MTCHPPAAVTMPIIVPGGHVQFSGTGLIVLSYSYFFAPNTYRALVVAL